MARDWRPAATAESGDRLPRLLADERRRMVLAVLAEARTPISLADLARRVARRRAERDHGGVGDATEDVHVALYHNHVPKLAAADLVRWDRERDEVRPGQDFQRAHQVVETVREAEEDARASHAGTADANGHPLQ